MANPDFRQMFVDLSAIYSQYLPENMTSAGFKTCNEGHWQDRYCPPPEENQSETQPKPNP
jgi:hypothetical protein